MGNFLAGSVGIHTSLILRSSSDERATNVRQAGAAVVTAIRNAGWRDPVQRA